MDSDFGNDEFFDGMDKQTARELLHDDRGIQPLPRRLDDLGQRVEQELAVGLVAVAQHIFDVAQQGFDTSSAPAQAIFLLHAGLPGG